MYVYVLYFFPTPWASSLWRPLALAQMLKPCTAIWAGSRSFLWSLLITSKLVLTLWTVAGGICWVEMIFGTFPQLGNRLFIHPLGESFCQDDLTMFDSLGHKTSSKLSQDFVWHPAHAASTRRSELLSAHSWEGPRAPGHRTGWDVEDWLPHGRETQWGGGHRQEMLESYEVSRGYTSTNIHQLYQLLLKTIYWFIHFQPTEFHGFFVDAPCSGGPRATRDVPRLPHGQCVLWQQRLFHGGDEPRGRQARAAGPVPWEALRGHQRQRQARQLVRGHGHGLQLLLPREDRGHLVIRSFNMFIMF